jgi:hypothetical protein
MKKTGIKKRKKRSGTKCIDIGLAIVVGDHGALGLD